MKIAYRLAAAIALTTVTLAAPAARAEPPWPLFGMSVDAYAAPTWDRSVTDLQTGQPRQGSRSMLGLATLLNWDGLAVGGVIDGNAGSFGNGRVSMGALAGWQPRFGTHRYQLLAEMGQEHFSGGRASWSSDTWSSRPSTPGTWLGYVGARLGMSETFGQDGPFEIGAWLFVRKDLGDKTVTNTAGDFLSGDEITTPYRVGGYSAGVALRVGVRFDQKRPSNESTVEVQYEPAKS